MDALARTTQVWPKRCRLVVFGRSVRPISYTLGAPKSYHLPQRGVRRRETGGCLRRPTFDAQPRLLVLRSGRPAGVVVRRLASTWLTLRGERLCLTCPVFSKVTIDCSGS